MAQSKRIILSLAALNFCNYTNRRTFAIGSPRSITVMEKLFESKGSKFSCDIQSGIHTFTSDLMPEAGGCNLGLSPKELLMSALGSCTAMTIRTYYENTKVASPVGWLESSLSEIHVEVREFGDHPHMPSKLTINIRMEGNLSSSQKERLVRAANACPIKKMLSGTVIDSFLII